MASVRVNFYELNESQVIGNTKLAAGSFICCKDSTNVYMVPSTGGAPVKMADTVIFLTDTQRKNLLVPIDGKFYFCTDTKKYWAYYGDWVCLNADVASEFALEATIPTTGTVTVSDSRITAKNTGVFIPDYSVSDLVSGVTVTCAAGKATIKGTCSYPIMGTLRIK